MGNRNQIKSNQIKSNQSQNRIKEMEPEVSSLPIRTKSFHGADGRKMTQIYTNERKPIRIQLQ